MQPKAGRPHMAAEAGKGAFWRGPRFLGGVAPTGLMDLLLAAVGGGVEPVSSSEREYPTDTRCRKGMEALGAMHATHTTADSRAPSRRQHWSVRLHGADRVSGQRLRAPRHRLRAAQGPRPFLAGPGARPGLRPIRVQPPAFARLREEHDQRRDSRLRTQARRTGFRAPALMETGTCPT